MKRFLITVITTAVVLLGIYYLIYYQGFYISGDYQGEMELPFKTEGQKLMVKTEESGYSAFVMKGVEVSSSLPGHFATDFYTDKEDYLRWFDQISEMGANTLKAARIMDDDFYDALFTHNTEHEEPLYLLQGISVSDDANYGSEDGYDDKFMGQLIRDGKSAVDIVHGRKAIALGNLGGTGIYRKDISQWVIGIVVGNDWNPDAVAATDHNVLHQESYRGTYFYSSEDSTPFESMLTQVMDEIVAYESDKYHTQRPIGFVNSPENDFLEYDENYAIQLKKYSKIDAENVKVSDKMGAGIFAAYRLFDYCDDFSAYLSWEEQQQLGDILKDLDLESSYQGYLQLLTRYHTIPVLLTEYGFSSARGAVRSGGEPNDEVMQGEKLMQVYRDAMEYGWSGVCISTWQDVWEQKTWNTSFAVDLGRRNLWHDLQTDGQNYGLMEFAPGEESSCCVIDGNTEEWEEKDQVYKENGLTLSARYDLEALYLLLEGQSVSPENVQYIPIDISSDVGSRKSDNPALTFDRNADFILCIDGADNTRLLVQERYQAMEERFGVEIDGKDRFVDPPEKDSGKFVPVQMAMENPSLLVNYLHMAPVERRKLTSFDTWKTGCLKHGNEEQKSSDYSTLADYYYGDRCVEIRIPWLLLNVSDPTRMTVHKDYYDHYGVENERIKSIWFGSVKEGNGVFYEFSVQGTGRNPKVRERLKDSYYVVQKEWKGM